MEMPLLHSQVYGNGRPLVILHGLLGSSANWVGFSRRMAEDGWQIHALDLRGHGQSFHSPEISYAAMAGDLLRYMDANGMDKVALIGHSMGGKTAMKMAVMAPMRVEKLVSVDIAPKYYPPHHDEIFHSLKDIDLSRYTSKDELAQVFHEHIPSQHVRLFLLKSLRKDESGRLEWAFDLKNLYANMDKICEEGLWEHEIYTGPALFLRGGLSQYILETDYPLIKKHFPNAQIIIVPHAAHWVHTDAPEFFYQAVSSFLQ